MARIFRCPRCGYRFSLSYARVTSCSGCRYSVLGDCGYVRCPNCSHEFQSDRRLAELRGAVA